MILGVIPARGGSRGLPGKNLRPLGGMPLVAHTIRAALASKIDRAIVSTDDPAIAAVAREHGADVPFVRPAELATDTAGTLGVIQHALREIEASGQLPTAVAILQPTSPFRTGKHIDEAIDVFRATSVDSVVGMRKTKDHTRLLFSRSENGQWSPLSEEQGISERRQDLRPQYAINGAIYLTRRSYYAQCAPDAAAFNRASCVGYEMDPYVSIDIDTAEDLACAEALWSFWKGRVP